MNVQQVTQDQYKLLASGLQKTNERSSSAPHDKQAASVRVPNVTKEQMQLFRGNTQMQKRDELRTRQETVSTQPKVMTSQRITKE